MSDTPMSNEELWSMAGDLSADITKLGEKNDALERDLARLQEKLSRLPADWEVDSSLETWFPFSAEELARLRAELAQAEELHQMQMAAISTAALMNTRQSDPPLNKDHPYWTPSYQDTIDAVGREIQWREKAEQAEAERDKLRDELSEIKRAYTLDVCRVKEAEAKLADWQQLVIAATSVGTPKIEGINLPELWPNKWHQDCAMVAYTIKNLHDALAAARSEGMEAGMQWCATLVESSSFGSDIPEAITKIEAIRASKELCGLLAEAIRAEIAKGEAVVAVKGAGNG